MSYVIILEDGSLKETSLRELTRTITKSGETSPPEFHKIEDENLLLIRLMEYNVYPLTSLPNPDYDKKIQELGDYEITEDPELGWVKQKAVIDLTPEQIEIKEIERKNRIDNAMFIDMQRVADPIFMKYQAGEATKEEWLAARQMVKEWYADNN